jgi:hypothetical protein
VLTRRPRAFTRPTSVPWLTTGVPLVVILERDKVAADKSKPLEVLNGRASGALSLLRSGK